MLKQKNWKLATCIILVCMTILSAFLLTSCKGNGNVYKNDSFQVEVPEGWYIYENPNANPAENSHMISSVTLVKSEEDYKLNPLGRLSFVTVCEFIPTEDYPYENVVRQYEYDINGIHWEGFDIPINAATYTIFTDINGRYFQVYGASYLESGDPRYVSIPYEMDEVKDIIRSFKKR